MLGGSYDAPTGAYLNTTTNVNSNLFPATRPLPLSKSHTDSSRIKFKNSNDNYTSISIIIIIIICRGFSLYPWLGASESFGTTEAPVNRIGLKKTEGNEEQRR